MVPSWHLDQNTKNAKNAKKHYPKRGKYDAAVKRTKKTVKASNVKF